MPDLQAISAFHESGKLLASGDTMPIPVITALLFINIQFLFVSIYTNLICNFYTIKY